MKKTLISLLMAASILMSVPVCASAEDADTEPPVPHFAADKTEACSGEQILLTAKPESKDDTCKFIVHDRASDTWYKLQDFSSETSYTWTTGKAGVKDLFLDIRDKDGNVERSSLEVTVNTGITAALSTSLSADESGTLAAPANTAVTLAADARGTAAPLSYKFIVHNKDNDSWWKIQDFSANASAVWNTGRGGNKEVLLDVRDSVGNVVRTSQNISVTAGPLVVTGFSSSNGSKLVKNQSTVLTASADGGTGNYKYKFIVYNRTSNSWYKLRDFDSSPSINWSPGSYGDRILYVDIKDDAGVVVRSGMKISAFVSYGKGFCRIGVPPVSQLPNYPTGCEAASAAALLRYYGYNISADRMISTIPRQNLYRQNGRTYGPSIYEKFVGDPRHTYTSASPGYGAFAPVVTNAVNSITGSSPAAKNITGASMGQLYRCLADGKPVIVWATYNMKEPSGKNAWYIKTPHGDQYFSYPRGTHVMVLVGFNSTNVYVMDPYGGSLKTFSKSAFSAKYSLLGHQAVIIDD